MLQLSEVEIAPSWMFSYKAAASFRSAVLLMQQEEGTSGHIITPEGRACCDPAPL